jgi:hypothetical protein
MEQILTEEEVRVMYQEKQREPFPGRRNVMGILLASLIILGFIAIYLALWALLMHIFGANTLPDDIIKTAMS